MKTLFLLLLCLCPLCCPAVVSAEELADGTTVEAAGEALSGLLALLPESWEGWVTLAVTLCAAVSALWPRPAEDAPALVRLLYTVVNALGINVAKAKNADDAAARKLR